ncbi:MAG TPA: hypothetical protein PLL77_03310 [Pyrinomonadaceae bacterium]|nr:hypothetical protein [Pyrinomonadaceae bacterium]
MKTLFTLATVMVVLFLFAPNEVEAQKRKTTAVTNISPSAKCAVVVRNDLIPNRGVVVVGCDSFGDIPFAALNDNGTTRQDYIPSNGGLIVFDAEMNVLFKWEACSACGGFFNRFAGTKKFKGRSALWVHLDGVAGTIPLYFDGRTFKFAEMP